MGRDTELIHLEQQIERLLQGFAALKDENERLRRDLHQATSLNVELRQQLDVLDEERGDVRSRVGTLIERIERWEIELSDEQYRQNDTQTPVDDDAYTPVDEHRSAAEQQMGDQIDTTIRSKQERDGGVQGSLFSG